nr:MAG TPA: hypothetical protein [Caudoviricetes sp.]
MFIILTHCIYIPIVLYIKRYYISYRLRFAIAYPH